MSMIAIWLFGVVIGLATAWVIDEHGEPCGLRRFWHRRQRRRDVWKAAYLFPYKNAAMAEAWCWKVATMTSGSYWTCPCAAVDARANERA